MPETAPPQEPIVVRMPIVRLVPDGQRVVFEVVGSAALPPGAMNGKYLGINGYVDSLSDAVDVRGTAGGSATGTQGPIGAPGVDGKSAYAIWLDEGHDGTEADFLASLKGGPGPSGPQGAPGVDGQRGEVGATGPSGLQGAPGVSAYEIAVANGFKGSETGWLASLVGPIGPAGPTGSVGLQGVAGSRGDVGPQGPAGVAGSAGVAGATGPRGETGPQGQTGAQGPIGATGPQGPKGDTGAQGVAGPVGPQGAKGDTGDAGPKGDAAAALLGTVTVGETAVVAINAGLRHVTVTTPAAWGLVVGNDVILNPVVNAQNANGLPIGNYAVHGAVVTAANTLRVTLTVPGIALLSSYSITCRVRRLI